MTVMAAFCNCACSSSLLSVISFILLSCICEGEDVDSKGYVVYCPCMGRFGNQADHFLGALGFAKGLDRTLILPPWVEYRQGNPKSVQVPFDTYFQVSPLLEFHRVITMERFMKTLARNVWPAGNRSVFCYRPREDVQDCKAKDGNPFGPFWDTFQVDFDKSEFYGPLHYDVYHHDMSEQWNERYPPSEYPVLAFMGAPASFPVQAENKALHKYLVWSDAINKKAENFVKTSLPKGGFVGIHLRNGIDWKNACEHVDQSPNLFAAPQCLGYRNENGRATKELCFPSKSTILKQVKKAVKDYKAKSVFVASDSDYMLEELSRALRKLKALAFRHEQPDPHVDLAILGRANHFIGNCISTFSAFAKRERDALGFPSSFWAFPLENESNFTQRDEL